MKEKQQEKSPIKQNILLYLENKGVTPYEFYKESGVTRGILQQNNGISEDNIARFLAYAPDVNIEWLLTSKGSMIKDGSTDIQISNDTTTSSMPTTSMNPGIGTPYYDVDFIGGFDEVFNSQVNIPATNIVIRGFEKASLWCNVTGHSMEPKINHGDIIALHQCTLNDIQYGEIYAVVLDTIRTIKILRRSPKPDKLRFIPINTNDYDEQEFDKSRIINVFEVIGSISKFF
ncbi:S24 family peptidase [Bacteroides stercoris]|uniref:S24 family peptidase n=1 Tax=Bacteroides stercoris TaxID=46506 RepID=UPI0022E2A51B|nr:S24 family peptidase [Bacteroides stercoris]